MPKKALITGITGQDGSYLAEFLLQKGYEVHGIQRRSSSFNTERIDHLHQESLGEKQKVVLHYGDMTDTTNLFQIIQKVKPDEIYNLAAQSHVRVSFEVPEYTADTDGLGVLRLLEAIKTLGTEKKIKFYQASTSELFSGKPNTGLQNKDTVFCPRSPYAAAKLYAYWITIIYREAYNIFACNGILFNHESPRRGENFVTRKITRAVARISLGLQDKLYLGNLNAKRDWGHSKDYIEAMWMMLQQQNPDDYVVATGKQHSIREFCEFAFKEIGVDLTWQGEGINEKGIDKKTNKVFIEVNPKYFRPVEVESLLGDPSKTKEKLGWEPKISFQGLVKEMVKSDIEKAKEDACLKKNGFRIKEHFN